MPHIGQTSTKGPEEKTEWEEQLILLLSSEPGAHLTLSRKAIRKYVELLRDRSDSYYGISSEIIIAIEKHLEL